MEEIRFLRDRLRFRDYPYEPARIFPNGDLEPQDVLEVVANWAPPVVRTRDSEFLIVSAVYRDQLLSFASSNDLTVCERVDVWDLLLRPFVEEPLSDGEVEDIDAQLERYGLGPKRVRVIRKRVGPWIKAYNAIHHEPCHLGLVDVLDAMLPLNTPRLFARFYQEAMELAALGPRCVTERRTPLS